VGMRKDLGIREPDHSFGSGSDITTIRGAVLWSLSLVRHLWSRRRLRDEVFGGGGGICVVHGDTPSTLLSMLMAKRAGLKVAHLEAGLRSGDLLNPFPEEAIRIVVMRWADLCYAPTAEDEANLRAMRRHGKIVPLESNTSVEAVRFALGELADGKGEGPAVVTMHRVENLRSKARVEGFIETVAKVRRNHPVTFVVHGPTQGVLERNGAVERLREMGIEMVPLVPHDEFLRMVAAAPLVVIDGGSIQEECGYLGVPTLLWRDATERSHGVGRNVVLSHHDQRVVDEFLASPETYRFEPDRSASSPSRQILDSLLDELAASTP
jgi:UDP-N-acetylglucosamine 2-epimerase (non-hydrolysing)